MNGESIDIKQERLQRLRGLFPELFAEGQLDWEKLKAAFGEDINFVNERYVLNWAGKADAFRVLQQPTTATLKPVPEESLLTTPVSPPCKGGEYLTTPLIPLLDKEGNLKSGVVDFISSPTENIFIEGENLEVLKVLQKAYYGKIKCIIIDPPYNTGSDSFIYPDRFSEKKEDYLKRIGDKDEEGYLMKEGLFRKNSKDSGHFHSNWLSMMYPRLFLAKNLLRDDGVIFVHIDDNEVHNLRMVMNEIFGEENFICQFIWKSRLSEDNRNISGASIDHEYILCFQKANAKLFGTDKDLNKFSNPDNDPRGPWRSADLTGLLTKDLRPNCHYDLVNPETGFVYKCPPKGWRFEPKTMAEKIKEKRILWPDSPEGRPRHKLFMNEMASLKKNISSLIVDVSTLDGSKEVAELFGPGLFSFPKPHKLTKILCDQVVDKDDIVLDFFGGSATTAHAVLELNKEDGGNRKFILVQMLEPCDESSEAYKAGYKTIADIAKERIRRVIRKIQGNTLAGGHSRENGNPEGLFKNKELDSRLQTAGMTKEDAWNDKTQDLGFKVFKLSPSSFKIWRSQEITEENLEQQLDAFTNPARPGAEKQNMLYELMLKAGYGLASPLTLSQSGEGNYYSVNDGKLIIALDVMSEKLVEQIIAAKPQKVITLDSLFAGNDQLKTNTVLQMRDAGVDFKTI